MDVSVGEIEATLKLKDELTAQLGKAQQFIEKFGTTTKLVGAGLTAALTVPLAAIGTASLKAAKDLDEAFDDIRIGTGAIGDDLKELEGSFKSVFRSVPNDAKDVSFAITELSRRLDLTGPALERMATQVLTLSRITKTDLNQVIPQAAKLFESWSVSTAKQSDTLDFLFKTSQQTGVQLGKLLDGVTETGAAFRALGFDLETSAALIGQFEKEGVNAQQVLSAMQIAARRFADANIPLAEGLTKTIKQIQDFGPGTKSAALAADVFGRSSTAMAEAVLKGKLNVDELLKAIRSSGETIEKAAKDTDGFAESWGKFRNNLMLALEPLGKRLLVALDQLQPAFLKVVDALTTVTELFASLPPSVQTGIIALAGIAAVAGPAALAVEKITLAVAGLRAGLALLSLNPFVLALTAVGGAAIYAAVEIEKLNAKTKQWIQDQQDAKTVADFTDKLRKGLQTTQQEADAYREALKRLDNSIGETRSQTIDLGEGFKGVGISLEAAQAGLAGVDSAVKNTGKEFSLGKKEVSEFQKAVDSLFKKLSGQNAEEDIEAMAQALSDMNRRGIAVTKSELPGLIKQLDEWLIAGHKLRPVLQDLMRKNVALVGPIANVGDGFDNFTKSLQNHWPAVERTGDAYLEVSKKIKEFNSAFVNRPNALNDLFKGGISQQDLVDARNKIVAMQDATKNSIKSGLLDAANSFPDMLANAIIHGKGIAEAFRSVLVQGASDVGKAIGERLAKAGSQMSKFLGSVFGALGAIGGDLIGKAFNSLISINKNVTKETREEFAKSMGFENLGKLYDDLKTLGAQGQKLADIGLNVIGRKDEAGNKRWMKDVENFYDMIQKEAGEVEKAISRTDILWTKEMQQFINKTPEFGDAIKGQLASAATGLTTFLSKGVDATKSVADIKKQIADLDGNEITGIGKKWDELNKKLLEQQGILDAVGIKSQGAAEAFGGAIAGIFGTLTQNGVSVIDALAQVEPAVSALQTQLEAAGLSGGAAFDSIRAAVDLVKDPIAGPVLQAVQGLDGALIGLNNTGLLTQQSFEAITGQISQAFNALVSQGKDGDQVLRLMAGPLQTVWELQKDFGFAVDEATKALLDQAEAAGIVGEKQRDPMEKMIKALDRMTFLLEQIAIKFGAIPTEAQKAAGGINSAFSGVNVEVPVKFRWGKVEPPEGVTIEAPGFQGGTHGQYIDFGGGTPVMLHGRERVMTEGEADGGWPAGGMMQPIVINLDGLKFLEVMARTAHRHGAVMPLTYS